ncbi:MAG: hypothetical protein RIK87_04850 [Fuerstiella sp.]
MAIGAECPECGRQYRLPDDKAGRKIRCKECGAVVDVPRRAGRARRAGQPESAGKRTAAARRPARGRSSGNKRSSKNNPALLIGGIVVGVVVCIAAGVFFGMQMMSGGGAATGSGLADGSTGTAGPGVTADDLTDEQKAQKQAAYEASLEQQRLAKSGEEKASLVRRYGDGKVVTIVISGVVGETAAANKYLNRKVFRAAYKEYEAGRKQAADRTESNRKAAEQQAVADHKSTWGDFGPTFVSYRYELVDSDVPYPRIVNGGRLENTFTFHAAPASNPQEFAQRLGLGTVTSINGREIHVQAQLPTPIPDPDVEELALQYGLDQVVQVNVTGATGDPKLVQLYLENETIRSGADGKRLSLVAMKALGNGEFQFSVAPVPNAQVFGESLRWGSLQSGDPSGRTVTIAAQLPEHLPTEAELNAAKEAERKREKAIRDADWAHKPRPDESELDWAVRVITDIDVFGLEKALKALAVMDVVEERRDEVSKLLIQNLGAAHFKLADQIPAMMRWKTDDTEKAILRLGGQHLATWDRPVVMEALVELGTPACAEALASALPDFFSGDKCVKYLIDAGPVAEGPVLGYLKHENAKVRARVYTILSEIGGKEAATKLRTNVKLENNPGMKAQAEACLNMVRERVNAARDATEKGVGFLFPSAMPVLSRVRSEKETRPLFRLPV